MKKLNLLCLLSTGLFTLNACHSELNDADLQQPSGIFKPPVVSPSKISNPVRFDPDKIKAIQVTPVVRHFDIDKLPSQSFVNQGFKPYTKPVKKKSFDFEHLPQKYFNIDKPPSTPLKITTYALPPLSL